MNNGYPVIIQGGMGAGVSNWQLAQAVSKQGQLGVVAGTALDQIFARRLQDGDPGGHMRRAMDNFPFPEMAERVWREYYIPGGRAAGVSYKRTPKLQKDNPRDLLELSLAGNFAEVWLARQGHTNPVGINYLEKIQTALLSAIYGAMLGGVEYVIVGAGIPIKVPGVLDALANHQPASYPLAVSGVQDGDDTTMHFDPRELMERELPPMKRPRFLAIIASNVLGTTLLKRSNGKVDGLIIEHHTAGGHNAPPRGKLQLTPEGEAIYGERDVVDIAAIAALGVPFWLAGGYGSHEKLLEAQAAGATGVQVGTAFAYSNESGLREDYKQALRQMARDGKAKVFTDPHSSPTGFPFKAALLEHTYSDDEAYLGRPRVCDLGYLREAYRTPEGTISYRCAAEPLPVYASHGGDPEKAVGKRCLCNALLANIGQQQVRGKYEERGFVTSGNALKDISDFQPADGLAYSAADVIEKLLKG